MFLTDLLLSLECFFFNFDSYISVSSSDVSLKFKFIYGILSI